MKIKLSDIMLKRTVLPAVLIIFLGITLWAFKQNNRGNDDSKEQLLLSVIGNILEQKHYSPKPIDDNFSKQVFKKYLESLNPDKNIFLQSDIDNLKKYELTLDDEIHGAPLNFYPEASAIYLKRVGEIMQLYKEILAQPFDFTTKENINLDDDKASFPADEAARKEVWRKRLKYLTLDQYTDLLQQRSRNMDDTAFNKSDAQLQQMAREKVQSILDRSFNRQKLLFTGAEQFNEFVNVVTDLMDPHTEYLPPVENRGFEEELSGRFYGIGAQLKDDDGAIKIANLITGMPAWKSGQVQPNDEIIKVAQGANQPVDVRGYGVTDVVKLIRGSKGTEVRITFRKADGSTQVVSLIRDEIVQDEQFARSAVVTEGNAKIGYIFLPEFYVDFERPDGNRCSQDVANEIIKLKKENVQGIILDLRNNGGGSLPEVVNMVGLFIKSGPVVQVKDRNGKPAILSDNDTSVLYSGPLAVMVNEFSASASEIFAAAIQDYKRGIIVGSDTYGKGTVQRTLPLGKPLDLFSGQTEYGTLKLTFEKFYRINGGSTQLKGVTPDVNFPDEYDYLKLREKDQPSALGWDQLQKADYSTFNSGINWSAIEEKAKNHIKSDSAFNLLIKNSQWLNENIDKEYSLNLEEYQKEQNTIKKTVKLDDSLARLSSPMNIEPVSEDHDKYYNNADSAKGNRYLQWLKNTQKDIYIKETVSVVDDMANSK